MNQELPKHREYKNEPTSKSIFNYVTDSQRFSTGGRNEKESVGELQKLFIQESSYTLTGVPAKQIDIENEMRGNNKILSSYACKDLSKLNN
jgi:hypothetical protein